MIIKNRIKKLLNKFKELFKIIKIISFYIYRLKFLID